MDPILRLSLSNFAARFCNELEEGTSVVCCPLSAESVLALTMLGSSGDTRAELLQAMGVPDDDAIRSLFGYISSRLSLVRSVKLRVANRVYVTKKGALKPSILKDAAEVFESGLEQVDFTDEAAAEFINKWVAKQTHNKITNVVSPDALDEDTRLLLINAIYFQGSWEAPFTKKLTENKTFHINNTRTTKVPMMCMEGNMLRYRHSRDLKAQLLQLSYAGHEASMIVVVPDDVEGLGGMLQQLAAGHDLLDEVAELRSTRIDVFFPKFKIETNINLKQLLPKMGIKSIFDEYRSDIRMLTSNERLWVSEALQRAVIEVNEEGTEAAACAMFHMVEICGFFEVEPPKRFVADRPFLYVLLVRGIPIFLGTYHGSGCHQ